MVKRHSTPIPPFPPADRAYFAAWLSGLTDGEGCFGLNWFREPSGKERLTARFGISLRADESPILSRIRSFFGCGIFVYRPTHNANPVLDFIVCNSAHLWTVVVPHFRQFPLQAKKAADFVIWAEGVELVNRVVLRKSVGRGRAMGVFPKWKPDESARFLALRAALKAQRVFNASAVPTPRPPRPEPRSLFDDLP